MDFPIKEYLNSIDGALFLYSELEKLYEYSKNRTLSYEDSSELFKFINEKLKKTDIPYYEAKMTYMLAEMNAKGIGVKKNSKKARELYEKMAKKGYTEACNIMFRAYRDGNSELEIEQDTQKTIDWAFQISDYDVDTPLYFIARKACGKSVFPYFDVPIDKDIDLAIKCLRKLILKPDVFVGIYSDLDMMIHNTVYQVHRKTSSKADSDELLFNENVSTDLWKTTGYYHITVESTHIFNLLGTIYRDNENFRNYEYAKNLFEQAVNAGSLDGEMNLSSIYFNGLGLAPNKEKAFQLRKHVAELVKNDKFYGLWDVAFEDEWKVLKTIEDVAEAYRYGIGVKISYEEALKWYSFINDHYWTLHISDDLKKSILNRAAEAIQQLKPLVGMTDSRDNKAINLEETLQKTSQFKLYFDNAEIDALNKYLLKGESSEEMAELLTEFDETLGKQYPEYQFFFHPAESA